MIDWQELFTLFETDDGSLPDIELTNLSGQEVINGYEFLRDLPKSFDTLNPDYWFEPSINWADPVQARWL